MSVSTSKNLPHLKLITPSSSGKNLNSHSSILSPNYPPKYTAADPNLSLHPVNQQNMKNLMLPTKTQAKPYTDRFTVLENFEEDAQNLPCNKSISTGSP